MLSREKDGLLRQQLKILGQPRSRCLDFFQRRGPSPALGKLNSDVQPVQPSLRVSNPDTHIAHVL